MLYVPGTQRKSVKNAFQRISLKKQQKDILYYVEPYVSQRHMFIYDIQNKIKL